MKKQAFYMVSILVILAVLLSSCAPVTATAEPTAPPEVIPTEVPESTQPEVEAGGIDCKGAQSGDEISMFYQWSGN
ncbi:MAG: hypothetical protein JW726_12335, partial [Anaerolineales bacterium]|nr:hypothetical protein [Anaerolineales bacterium]